MQRPMVIELGDDWSVAESTPPPGRPARALAALLALGALLLLSGSIPAHPAFTALVKVHAAPGAGILLTPDTLVVGDRAAGGTRLSGYTLPAGRLRWRIRTPGTPGALLRWIPDAGGGPGVVISTSYPTAMDIPQVAALDAGTGRLLWSGQPVLLLDAPSDDRVLLEVLGADGPTELRWVDLRTGRVRWSRPLPPGAGVTPAPPGTAVLVTATDGSAALVTEATGVTRVSGTLSDLRDSLILAPGPVGGLLEPTASRATLTVFGDQLFVQRPGDVDTGALTAYDLATLARQWTARGDVLGTPSDCPPVLCLAGLGGLVAVDRSTGAVRWQAARWRGASGLATGRLLGYTPGVSGALGVLDASTGRTLADAGAGWTVVPGTGTPVLLSRPAAGADSGFFFATVSVGSPPIRPLGRLADVSGPSCLTNGHLLSCATRGNRVQVWRLPG